MTAAGTDEDRLARAALSRVAEPGDAQLTGWVTERGAATVWAALRQGCWPDGAPAPRDVLVRVPEARPEADLAAVARMGGRLVVPGDAEWPGGLDRLAALGRPRCSAPLALWVRGAADVRFTTLRSVAVVGSRAATAYGEQVAGELGAQLADRGYPVVSGGAYGIDGAAHRGALAVGGGTVAVLACGVDVAYPRGHDTLFARIARTGLLVSEWPPGCAPMRHRFLVRNRVIAALTLGTVVVEAAVRSGALSTARLAYELSRPVMGVPGPVTSPLSAGCHSLLREPGVVLVTSAAEVLDAVGGVGVDLAVAAREPESVRDSLGELNRRVLDAVPARRGAGPARIAVAAGVAVEDVLHSLGELLAEGLVERVDGGWRLDRAAAG